MPIAPRQGRKGGKVTASPSVGPASATPGSISPGSVFGPTGLLPSEPTNDLEFNLEALMNSKQSKERKGAAAGVTSSTEASPAATAAPPVVSTGSNVLKFDLDAIEQIGQGVVVGAARAIRTDMKKPNATPEEMEAKAAAVFLGLKSSVAARAGSSAPSISHTKILPQVRANTVTVVERYHTALTIAVELSRTKPEEKVLVVVARPTHVSVVSSLLREMSGSAPTGVAVGELHSHGFDGAQATPLWVTSSENALLYLTAQKSLAPFSYVVVPGMSRMTLLTSYFLWGLRERVFRRSNNFDPSAPPLSAIVCASEFSSEAIQAFFANTKNITTIAGATPDVTEINYDEACALAGCNVLEMEIDRSGKHHGPHPKLTEHCIRCAAAVTAKLLSMAKSPLCVYVLTGDIREMGDALLGAKLSKDVAIYSGRNSLSGSESPTYAPVHRVTVLRNIQAFTEAGSAQDVNVVIDLGTFRRSINPNKSESFIRDSSTEWQSQVEHKARRLALTEGLPGVYVSVFPPAAVGAFPAKDSLDISTFDVEDAILQCARAGMPINLAKDALVTADDAAMEQAHFYLSEKCLIASPMNATITFVGEMASRVSLEHDFSSYVINCVALGLGEASIAVACVSSLPFFPSGRAALDSEMWKSAVLASRTLYAQEVSTKSDVLADTLVFLQWLKLKVEGCPTAALLEELCIAETHMLRVEELMHRTAHQLKDYTFLDSFDDVRTVKNAIATIHSQSTLLTFIQSVTLSRRTCFVRDSGNMNSRDRSGALVFVRTAKKVRPNFNAPSSVPWDARAAFVAVELLNAPTFIIASRFSAISTSYFFASLLLLFPQVEYSDPVETPDGEGQTVYFGVLCNRQMKRFRVRISEAAQILDFRERINVAFGYLQAARISPKSITRRKFEARLKEVDRLFNLENFHHDIQNEFLHLVTELDVSENQGSFETAKLHCITPKCPLELPAVIPDPSDMEHIIDFRSGKLWQQTSPVAEHSPPSLKESSAVASIPAHPVEDDEDDVEIIEDSYFEKFGPIVEDDDD